MLFQISLDSGNPFMAHKIYKTTRKLALPETNDRRKRTISDTKESDDTVIATNANFVDCRYVNAEFFELLFED